MSPRKMTSTFFMLLGRDQNVAHEELEVHIAKGAASPDVDREVRRGTKAVAAGIVVSDTWIKRDTMLPAPSIEM